MSKYKVGNVLAVVGENYLVRIKDISEGRYFFDTPFPLNVADCEYFDKREDVRLATEEELNAQKLQKLSEVVEFLDIVSDSLGLSRSELLAELG